MFVGLSVLMNPGLPQGAADQPPPAPKETFALSAAAVASTFRSPRSSTGKLSAAALAVVARITRGDPNGDPFAMSAAGVAAARRSDRVTGQKLSAASLASAARFARSSQMKMSGTALASASRGQRIVSQKLSAAALAIVTKRAV